MISAGLVTTLTLAALFFLYVGVEVSLGSWAAAYAKRLPGGGEGISTLAPMFFYGGLLSGRAFAPFVLARVREYRLVIVALTMVIIAKHRFRARRYTTNRFRERSSRRSGLRRRFSRFTLHGFRAGTEQERCASAD